MPPSPHTTLPRAQKRFSSLFGRIAVRRKHPGEPVIDTAMIIDGRLPGIETPAFDNAGSCHVTEPTLIDIATTKIIDSRDLGGGNIATLSTFFAEISGGKLKMSTDAVVVDTDDREVQGTFYFKYDTATDQFGAGTAFLRD